MLKRAESSEAWMAVERGQKRPKLGGWRFATLILLLLVGLYAVMRVRQAEKRDVPEDRSIVFGVSVAALPTGSSMPVLRARRGDKLVIHIESEVAGEFHLHGYDREAVLKPGGKASLALEAERSGQFPIELHEPGGGHRDIARLVVEP